MRLSTDILIFSNPGKGPDSVDPAANQLLKAKTDSAALISFESIRFRV